MEVIYILLQREIFCQQFDWLFYWTMIMMKGEPDITSLYITLSNNAS